MGAGDGQVEEDFECRLLVSMQVHDDMLVKEEEEVFRWLHIPSS